MNVINYSRGRNKHDNRPQQRQADDFAAFVAALDRDRAPAKGLQYFCGPFNGAGMRNADGALQRRFLPVDIDRIDRDTAPDLRMWFARFSGVAWPTHSSTEDAPRERVVLELSRDATRAECIAIGAVLARDLRDEFGAAINVDETTFRPEQPNYCPPVAVNLARFDGAPLDVDAYLEQAPAVEGIVTRAAKVEGAIGEDSVLAHLQARGLVRKVGGDGKAWIHCPFESEHTLLAEPFGTVWFAAHTNGYRAGHFSCLHQHCTARTDAEFLKAVGYSGRADDGASEPPESPKPIDILRPLAAPPLRVEDVPAVLGEFAAAQARATGFDVSIMLMAGVTVAAALISDELRLCVSSRSSWFESARLWGVIIGGPGAGKSPGIKVMAAPLFKLHRELIAAWAAQHIEGDREAPPKPALYTSDATTEALSELLRDNDRGVLYLVDELESWLASHDTYRSGAGRDRGEWLRLYDGGPHQVNRITRGSFFVPNWGASLLSATTPAALAKLAPKLPDDGLLQRLLLVVAQPRVLIDSSMLMAETRPQREAYEAALQGLHSIPAGVVHLSADARDVFDAEQKALHQLTLAYEDAHPSYAAHLAKRTAMLARLALTFHALEAADPLQPIGATTMTMAVRFLRRQEGHAMAVYSTMLGADTGLALAKAAARSILASRLDAFNRRELTHACRAFRTANEHSRLAGLQLLEDCGWLRSDDGVALHGTSWRVDRRVHELFAAHGEAARQRRNLVRDRMLGHRDGEENES